MSSEIEISFLSGPLTVSVSTSCPFTKTDSRCARQSVNRRVRSTDEF